VRVERRRVADQIFEELRRRIVSGLWVDGSQLPTERELAAEFEVSPNTIRESIRALGALGLVEVRQGSGAYVRLTPSALVSSSLGTVMRIETVPLVDVLELSRHLHLRIADLAIERATEEDVDRLQAFASAAPAPDGPGNARQVAEFLGSLIAAAHEPLVGVVAGSLDGLIIETIATAFADDPTGLVPDLRAIRGDWARIVDGIRSRDPQRARDAVGGYYDAAARIIAAHDALRDARMRDDLWTAVLEDLSVGRFRRTG
jgi:GntR family transcriptional regulator, transcriptional repressor for pyruvate dehydrogenase complex